MYGIARNAEAASPHRRWCLFRLDGHSHMPGSYALFPPLDAVILDELPEGTDVERLVKEMEAAAVPAAQQFLAFLQERIYDPFLHIYLDNIEGLLPVRGAVERSAAYYTLYHRAWGAIVFTIDFAEATIMAQSMSGEATATHPLVRGRAAKTGRWEIVT